MEWAEHVASMGKKRTAYKGLVRKPERKEQWGNLYVCETIILKWISKKENVASSCKQGNERLTPQNLGNFLCG
jgi:hypothetical protein